MPRSPQISKKNRELLLALQHASSATRKAVLSAADKSLVNALVACLRLIVENPDSLSTSQYETLRRRSGKIREALRVGATNAQKKRALQSGGFLNLLLPLATSLLGGLFGGQR